MRLTLRLDGREQTAEVDERMLLVDALRERFGRQGTHVGCRTGDCGACTVRLDGQIVKSCLVLAAAADGRRVETIEGLAGEDGALSAVQEAFVELHGFQCGFCLPGMLLAAEELLEEEPRPTRAQIRRAISGNLCRCTGYENVIAAVEQAAARRGGAAA